MSAHARVKTGLFDALEQDPNSSDAAAALAILHVDEYRLPFHKVPKPELLEIALEYGRTAIVNDAQNGFAYLALALAHFHRRDLSEFEIAAEEAIRQNPGHAHTLAEISFCYCLISDFSRSIPLADRAIALSPVHPGWFRLSKACKYFVDGKTEMAIHEQKKSPIIGFFWYHAYIVAYYAVLGDEENLAIELEQMLSLYPDFSRRVFVEADIWCVKGAMPLKMLEGWDKAGLVIERPPGMLI